MFFQLLFLEVWDIIFLRHNHIVHRNQVCSFYFSKSARPIFAYLFLVNVELCRSNRGCVFRCAASAAHFLFLERDRPMEKETGSTKGKRATGRKRDPYLYMPKKSIWLLVSGIGILVILAIAGIEYWLLIRRYTVGSSIELLVTLPRIVAPLIRIAAFFPLLPLFRCILNCGRGKKLCIVVGLIVLSWYLNQVGNSFFGHGINQTATGSAITALQAYLLFNLLFDIITTIFWVAAAQGVGLIKVDATLSNAETDPIQTQEFSGRSYLKQYKERRKD